MAGLVQYNKNRKHLKEHPPVLKGMYLRDEAYI